MQDACCTVAGVTILLMQHGKGCCSAVVSFCKVTSHKAVEGEEGTGTCFTAICKGRSDRSASCPTASSLGKCQVVAGGKEQLTCRVSGKDVTHGEAKGAPRADWERRARRRPKALWPPIGAWTGAPERGFHNGQSTVCPLLSSDVVGAGRSWRMW